MLVGESRTRLWSFVGNRKCRCWRRRGAARGRRRASRTMSRDACRRTLRFDVGLRSLSCAVRKWRRILCADLTQVRAPLSRERKSSERFWFRLAIPLDFLFHPSGGSMLSDDRAGGEDDSKWALLPLSEGWLPGDLSFTLL